MFTTCVDWERGVAVYLVTGVDTPADSEAFTASAIGFPRVVAHVERPTILLAVEPEDPAAGIAWAWQIKEFAPRGPGRVLCGFVSPSAEARLVVNAGSWHASRHVELFAAPDFGGAVAEVERRRREKLPGLCELLRQAREAACGPHEWLEP